ncbi:hypothetical protein [Nocardia sp. CA-120079]|uniref:hypothetical protein n=1 Tax=Nocardia sp. CA-120079 TaxID=3239974 RepID=UPI003D968BE1
MKPPLTPWFSHAATTATNWAAKVLDRASYIPVREPSMSESIDVATHAETAARFRCLAEQDVQHLALLLCRAAGESSRYSAAHRTGLLCRALCLGQGALPVDVGSGRDVVDLAADVVHRLAEVLREARAAGGRVWFDFETSTQGPLTDAQEPWTLCDPDLPVSLVAIPSYVVNGMRMSHQIVFTGTPDGVHDAPRAAACG